MVHFESTGDKGGGAVVDTEAEEAVAEMGVGGGEGWSAVDGNAEIAAAGGDFEGVGLGGMKRR